MDVFVVLLFVSLQLWAQRDLTSQVDGNRLLTVCGPAEKETMNDPELAMLQFCYGYLAAVADDNDTWQSLLNADGNHRHDNMRICLPEKGIPMEQAARIVLKYLRDNPDKLHWSGAPLVHNALRNAFRCA